jgi:plastocyanin
VTYRLLTSGSVEIDMMKKQMSKKKLERLTMQGGDYRKAGRREGQQSVTLDVLRALLQDDVKNLHRREQEGRRASAGADVSVETGTAVEWIQKDISDHELDLIMDRRKLFPEMTLSALPSTASLLSVEGATSVDSGVSVSGGSGGSAGRKRKTPSSAEEEVVVLDYGEYNSALAAASPHKTPRKLRGARGSAVTSPALSSGGVPAGKGRRSTPGSATAAAIAADSATPSTSTALDTTTAATLTAVPSEADIDAALAAAWEAERAAAAKKQLQGSVPLEGEMYDIVPESKAEQVLLSLS